MALDLFTPCRDPLAFLPLSSLPYITLDLRYAGPRNICGCDLYRGEREAWLRLEAHRALAAAAQALAQLRPGWGFRVFDAARPLSVQRRLFAQVAGTPQQAYVADPAHGSPHNYGLALDLALQDAGREELDHGTPFDSFEPLAQPQLEEAFLQQGRLSREQVERRRLLRRAMQTGGFRPHPLEWWHFDLPINMEEVRARFQLIPGDPV